MEGKSDEDEEGVDNSSKRKTNKRKFALKQLLSGGMKFENPSTKSEWTAAEKERESKIQKLEEFIRIRQKSVETPGAILNRNEFLMAYASSTEENTSKRNKVSVKENKQIKELREETLLGMPHNYFADIAISPSCIGNFVQTFKDFTLLPGCLFNESIISLTNWPKTSVIKESLQFISSLQSVESNEKEENPMIDQCLGKVPENLKGSSVDSLHTHPPDNPLDNLIKNGLSDHEQDHIQQELSDDSMKPNKMVVTSCLNHSDLPHDNGFVEPILENLHDGTSHRNGTVTNETTMDELSAISSDLKTKVDDHIVRAEVIMNQCFPTYQSFYEAYMCHHSHVINQFVCKVINPKPTLITYPERRHGVETNSTLTLDDCLVDDEKLDSQKTMECNLPLPSFSELLTVKTSREDDQWLRSITPAIDIAIELLQSKYNIKLMDSSVSQNMFMSSSPFSNVNELV